MPGRTVFCTGADGPDIPARSVCRGQHFAGAMSSAILSPEIFMAKTNTSDMEQLQRTADMFEMILRSAPMATENYENLKDLYRELGQPDKVKDTFLRLATQYASSGDPESARAELEKALDEFPGDPAVESRLAELGFTPPSFDFDEKILEYEDLCIQCEDVRVRLRLGQHAIEKAKWALRAAKDNESLMSDDSERSRAIDQILDNRIELMRTASVRRAIRGGDGIYRGLKASCEQEMAEVIEKNPENIAEGIKRAEALLEGLDSEFSARILDTEIDFHELEGEELERLRSEERKKLEEEFPVRLMEARKRAEDKVEAEQAEYQRTVSELSELEAGKAKMETLIEGMIENLPDGKRGRAKAEFLALSDGVILIPLDEDIVDDDEPITYRSQSSRIDLLARDLNLLEIEEPPVEPEPERKAAADVSGEKRKPPETPAVTVEKTTTAEVAQSSGDEVLERLSRRLGSMLLRHGVITEKNLAEALAEQKNSGQNLGIILAKMGFASDAEVLNCLSKETGMPYLPLSSYEINPKAAGLLPASVARKYSLVPVDMISNSLLICTSNALDDSAKAEIEKHARNMKLSYFVSPPGEVEERLSESYPS